MGLRPIIVTYENDIIKAWSWTGFKPPIKIIKKNAFANFIFRDKNGHFWRLCPEELTCLRIARFAFTLRRKFKHSNYSKDWEMSHLVFTAKKACGPLNNNESYNLVIVAPLGGKYEDNNFMKIPTQEVIVCTGEIALQTHNLPDGAEVVLEIVD